MHTCNSARHLQAHSHNCFPPCSLYPHMYARAYINFKNQEDIILFRDRFDGYVFLDNKGQEYPAIVEFAPFQKAAKKKTKKRDTKVGTIDDGIV